MLANKQQIVAAIKQIVESPAAIGEEGYTPYDGRKCVKIMTQNEKGKVQNFVNLLAQQISNNITVKFGRVVVTEIKVQL